VNVLSKNFDALKVFIILFIMENHSGKNVAAGKNIGRPIIVYDDDSGEKSKPSSSSEIRISKVRKLPGRDISISSSEDEEYDDHEIPKTIEIIEDPSKKVNPRKSSMVMNGASKLSSGVKKLEIVDSSEKCMTTSSSANELCKSTRFDELPSPVDSNAIPLRKRSVSFLPSGIESTIEGKSSSNPTLKMASIDLPREESLQEDSEDDEIKGMDHLQVSISDHARERRRSIENLVRPPTPPNACHSVKD